MFYTKAKVLSDTLNNVILDGVVR